MFIYSNSFCPLAVDANILISLRKEQRSSSAILKLFLSQLGSP